MLVKLDLVELSLGLQFGDKLVHFLSFASGEQDIFTVDFANVWHETLWVETNEVDGHVDLLLEIVFELSTPWLLESSTGELLKESALWGGFLRFTAVAHCFI